MDQYIPPVAAVATGLCTVFLCFLIRIPFFIVGLLSLILVVYALQDHLYRFTTDYRNFSAPDFLKQNASILIVSLVIILSLGFLLLKFGPKAVAQNQPVPATYGWMNPLGFFTTATTTGQNQINWGTII
jgi:hypothetical protein